MNFTGTDSCGNSPKNMFVARFEENLINGDREALAALLGLAASNPVAGHLEAAITHGKAAAAWGQWEKSSDGEDILHFSHTFWFRTNKAEEFAQIRVFQP